MYDRPVKSLMCDLNSKTQTITMATTSNLNSPGLRSCLSRLPLNKNATWRLHGLRFIAACMVLVSPVAAVAQQSKAKAKPKLVVGSKVSLSALTAADWIQGEGPKSFEPGKVYMFECWATWCGPCIALIPHVNELHEKYYDKGLRVYGMNSWEPKKKDAQEFVRKKGAGMSYPVAHIGKGSPFEKEWLDAAGVEAIPYAFVVRNGKLLLGTEASRLTNSLIETLLSGDEGAKKAAAVIKAAYDARGEAESLTRQIDSARRRNDAKKMAAAIEKLETIDPGHPELPTLKLKLLVTSKKWPAAVETLNKMPRTNSKNSFVMMTGMSLARRNAAGYPMEFVKAVTVPYSKYIADSEKGIGPNHFACLSILHWKMDDKPAAIAYARMGLEVARTFGKPTEARTMAFDRFAKLVQEGSMPKFSDLMTWHREAREKAAAARKKTPPADK